MTCVFSFFFFFGVYVFFFKQKTAYEMRISDWSSDVCSSDLPAPLAPRQRGAVRLQRGTGFLRSRSQDRHGVKHRRAHDGSSQWGDKVMADAAHPDRAPNRPTVDQTPDPDEIDRTPATERGSKLPHKIGRASCRERVCQYV